MEQVLYRIGEASAQLGLYDKNSNTLRSWVDEFKDFLGSSANPEAGRPRFFTEDDLRVLRAIRDLRANHLPYSEIRTRLGHGTHALERPAAAPAPEERLERLPTTDLAPTLAEQVQTLLAPMSRAADEWHTLAEQYRTRLEDREARVQTLEQRIESLQSRLEETHAAAIALHTSAIKRMEEFAEAQGRRRRWLFLF
ncbi:MAG TPA: MerR family transcriptional regulator [Chloroflexota bacterium]|nr:MerR family transcriptional regulator [Chloroflexota bacterium]